ncbi:TetR family transcriptional regulator [Streptomyces mirabilis]|uniref:TetR family transcriptional regulator n=1 Tax=Streptomyces mirabilis TaxID=68239 RepID=UPI003651A921
MSLRERNKLAAWRAIRAAALRLFEERGFEAVSVEEIAAAAGVSRSTFFNYFASKEAVVFDQDPEQRDQWRAVMAARPADEALWDSLAAILIGFSEIFRDRVPLQRRLKERSPVLAKSSWDVVDEQFLADLRDWVTSRTLEDDPMPAALQLNLALAAHNTAYQTWGSDESFDDYLQRLKYCLRQAGAGTTSTTTPTSGTWPNY